jgi:hypothetical protein|nr:MAG TPA: hypothetical protein [Caudoviricetes sp.]
MNFGNDPLLNYDAAQTMQADTDAIMRQIEELKQKRQAISMQAQVSQTPLFDEIDKIEDSFTDSQKQFLMQNQEYVESLQYVSKLVQDEELRIIRPRIEATERGKDALKHHLSVVQKLKKSMAKEEEQKRALLDDYLTNYPDMAYKDYLAMINNKKGNNK